jgi:hypothetical protein
MANSLLDAYRRSLADQGITDDRGDYEIMRTFLGPLAETNRDLLAAYPDFQSEWNAIRENNSPGTIGGLVNTAKSAFDRSRQALNVAGGIDEADAQDIAAAEQRIQERPSSVPWEDWQRTEGNEALKVFLQDPIEITSNIIASGLAGSLPSIGGGLSAGAAGAALGGPIGGTVGAIAGTGAGSLAVEYGNKYLETLRDAGADLTDPESILRVVNDPAVADRAKELGLKRGLPVAAFDAASAGIAGKLLKGLRGATTAQTIRRGVGEAAIQGALGGGGEVAGAVAAGEEIRPGAVFEEIVGELGPGAAEVAGAGIRRQLSPASVALPAATAAAPVPAPVVAPLTPVAVPASPSASALVATVESFAPEQQAARLSELQALPNRTPEQESELQLLRQLAPALPAPATIERTPDAVTQPVVAPAPSVVDAELSAPPVAAPEITSLFTPEVVQPPARRPDSDFLYTISRPQMEEDPGYIQVDEILEGRSIGSHTVEELVANGVNIPAPPPWLPTGQYTLEQINAAIRQGAPAAISEQLAASQPASEPKATPQEEVIAESPKPAEIAPVVPSTTPPPPSPAVVELQSPSVPLAAYGKIILGSPTTDLSEFSPTATPEQWEAALRTNVAQSPRSDKSGNRALTRVALALQRPDSEEVVVAGITTPQRINKSTGGTEVAALALQRMGAGKQKRSVKAGAEYPVALKEALVAGYRPLAVLHFTGEPTTIFQTFSTRADFNAAWDAIGRAVAAPISPVTPVRTIVTSDASLPVSQINGLARIEAEIDRIGQAWKDAERSNNKAEVDRLMQRYGELAAKQDAALRSNQLQTGDVALTPADFDVAQRVIRERQAQRLPIDAARAQQFAAVVERLRNQGARVDLFAQEFFNQSTRAYIEQQIAALQQRIAARSSPTLERQLATLNERLAAVDSAQGAAFSPYHIALSLEDVQNADTGNLVTLLHEAAESLAQGLNPAVRGSVQRAVGKTIAKMRQRAADAATRTGVQQAKETGEIDLLSEALAQEIAAEGVPEAPSIAQALVRWIKDLYYRIAMAAQRAFGREPDSTLALNWFENQMRRLVSGDYDFRLARLLDRYMRQPNVEQVRRFHGHAGTPGGVTDYFDPYGRSVRQPSVLTTSSDALGWNVEFRTGDSPGGQDIPEAEARARTHAAAVARVLERMEPIHQQSGSSLGWSEWWRLLGAGEDPRQILAASEMRYPGSSGARIGGERMTEIMNGLAAEEARRLLENIEFSAKGRLANTQEQIETTSDKVIEAAKEVNKLEGDRRNQQLHEAVLRDKLRGIVSRFMEVHALGLETAELKGELAAAVAQAEDLIDKDPIPESYQRVFKSIIDGEISVFDYILAIARLDLPLSDLTTEEVLRAIRANADSSETLKQLRANRPLAVALATLARQNYGQVDEIQLGYTRDAEQYRAIHEDLELIRQATGEQLREMIATAKESGKAQGLRQRLRAEYLRRRDRLQRARDGVARARQRAGVIEAALPSIAASVEQAQIDGAGAPSEWTPHEGARFTEMVLGADGRWSSRQRTLHFNADGSAVDGAAIRSAIFENNEWLKSHAERRGSRTWQAVERQTTQLMMLDLQRSAPAAHAWKITKMLAPIVDNAKRIGGPGSQRVVKMMNDFEFVRFSHGQEVQSNAQAWSLAWNRVQQATGIRDNGILQQRLYDPISYFLNTNPGLDEDAAIRHATREARARLADEPAENFNAAFAELLRQTKANSEYLVGLANQYGAFVRDPRLKSELRRAVAQGWLTNMRKFDGGLVRRIISDMEQAGWKLGFKQVESRGKTRREVVGATTFDGLAADLTDPANTQQLDAALRPLFTPGIIRDWLEPFINKGGTEIFTWQSEPVAQLDLQDAWQRADGNVLKFIDALAEKIGVPLESSVSSPGLAQFRLSILKQIDGLFGMEARHAYEWSQTRDLFDPMGPKPHVMMDARLNDLIPPEHLDFALYDPNTAQMLLSEIAFHAKFGRNGEAMVQALAEMTDSAAEKKSAYESLTGTTEAQRRLEAKARGWDYAELRNAAQRAADVEGLKNSIENLMAVGRPGGPFDQSRAGMAFMNFIVGQVVDNPKTGLYNWLSNFERPFAQRSLGPQAIRNSAKSTAIAIKGALGSLFEAFGLHLLHSSDYYKTVANAMGGSRNQPWSQAVADIGPGGKQDFTERVLVRPLKLIRYIQNKGVGSPAESREFPRAAPIPGLGVNNYLGQLAGTAGIQVELETLEKMITNGIRYFAANHEAASDPNFRFKGADVGLGRLDQGLFDWWRNNTVEYGMGTLEDIVRGAMPAQTRGEPLLTKDQVLRVAQMAMTEFDGTSSINTTPSFMQDNPVLRTMLPLLRWPFWKMNQVHKSLKTVDGRMDMAALMRGVSTLALWNLPIGLAFTFALDRYDEDLLGKKSNLPSVGGLAGVPLVGPVAELFAGDRSVPDTLKAYLVRSARAGNVYGMGSDLIGQFASPSDAASGRRIFSLDQRVLAMSQFLNFQQALSNAAHQDWTTTWASVWSPLFRSLGGNGALHAIDLTNKILGLDNAESRQVMRTNAANWLRAAASETDVELKAGGGSGTPTPMSVWTREMLTAAMANDRIGFMDAHRHALNAARKVVVADPSVAPSDREKEAERRVLSGWRARDPMSIFATRPTDMQMNRMLGIMSDDGRQDVRQALTRYQQFTRLIQPTAVEQRIRQRLRAITRPQPALQMAGMPAIGPLF